jgi:hypothetical protein
MVRAPHPSACFIIVYPAFLCTEKNIIDQKIIEVSLFNEYGVRFCPFTLSLFVSVFLICSIVQSQPPADSPHFGPSQRLCVTRPKDQGPDYVGTIQIVVCLPLVSARTDTTLVVCSDGKTVLVAYFRAGYTPK